MADIAIGIEQYIALGKEDLSDPLMFLFIIQGIIMLVIITLIITVLEFMKQLSRNDRETGGSSTLSFTLAEVIMVLSAMTDFYFNFASAGFSTANWTTFFNFAFFATQMFFLVFTWSISGRPREQINLNDLVESIRSLKDENDKSKSKEQSANSTALLMLILLRMLGEELNEDVDERKPQNDQPNVQNVGAYPNNPANSKSGLSGSVLNNDADMSRIRNKNKQRDDSAIVNGLTRKKKGQNLDLKQQIHYESANDVIFEAAMKQKGRGKKQGGRTASVGSAS